MWELLSVFVLVCVFSQWHGGDANAPGHRWAAWMPRERFEKAALLLLSDLCVSFSLKKTDLRQSRKGGLSFFCTKAEKQFLYFWTDSLEKRPHDAFTDFLLKVFCLRAKSTAPRSELHFNILFFVICSSSPLDETSQTEHTTVQLNKLLFLTLTPRTLL